MMLRLTELIITIDMHIRSIIDSYVYYMVNGHAIIILAYTWHMEIS